MHVDRGSRNSGAGSARRLASAPVLTSLVVCNRDKPNHAGTSTASLGGCGNPLGVPGVQRKRPTSAGNRPYGIIDGVDPSARGRDCGGENTKLAMLGVTVVRGGDRASD